MSNKMNLKVSGETEAKAILKGKTRQIQAIGDDILKAHQLRLNEPVKKNFSVSRHRYKEMLTWYGDFLIGERQFKKIGSGSSKHWKAEFFAIEPELNYADGIGDLCRFILGFFDSRKFCKGIASGVARFSSQFYFHEHFLIRCIHRLNEKSIAEIGRVIYPMIEWIIINNIPLRKFSESNYFVFKEFILVADKLPNGAGLIFKTLLQTDRLTEADEKKFRPALKSLDDSNGLLASVMTNSFGTVVSNIPDTDGTSLLNSLSEKSLWVQPLLTSPDIRTHK
jgi:hypothetical protein